VKPKIGIYGLSGCWGEQIVILNCEDQLMDLFGAVDIVDFLGGSSVNDTESRLLIAFVEGSVANAREEASLKRVRERSDLLVACGSCACFGGVAALDARAPRTEVIQQVYGKNGPAGSWDIAPHRPLEGGPEHSGLPYRKNGVPERRCQPAERGHADFARLSGMPRMQDAGERVPSCKARIALRRPRHSCRVRSPLPELQYSLHRLPRTY
jgi:NADH ubiquinone oxidoreductase, 20 Kd subunit